MAYPRQVTRREQKSCVFLRPEPAPQPERTKDKERPHDRRNNITQRDRDFVQARPDPEYAEQQSADDRASKTKREISPQPKASALPGHQRPGKASAEQSDDDPDNDLVDREHGRLLVAYGSDVRTNLMPNLRSVQRARPYKDFRGDHQIQSQSNVDHGGLYFDCPGR